MTDAYNEYSMVIKAVSSVVVAIIIGLISYMARDIKKDIDFNISSIEALRVAADNVRIEQGVRTARLQRIEEDVRVLMHKHDMLVQQFIRFERQYRVNNGYDRER